MQSRLILNSASKYDKKHSKNLTKDIIPKVEVYLSGFMFDLTSRCLNPQTHSILEWISKKAPKLVVPSKLDEIQFINSTAETTKTNAWSFDPLAPPFIATKTVVKPVASSSTVTYHSTTHRHSDVQTINRVQVSPAFQRNQCGVLEGNASICQRKESHSLKNIIAKAGVLLCKYCDACVELKTAENYVFSKVKNAKSIVVQKLVKLRSAQKQLYQHIWLHDRILISEELSSPTLGGAAAQRNQFTPFQSALLMKPSSSTIKNASLPTSSFKLPPSFGPIVSSATPKSLSCVTSHLGDKGMNSEMFNLEFYFPPYFDEYDFLDEDVEQGLDIYSIGHDPEQLLFLKRSFLESLYTARKNLNAVILQLSSFNTKCCSAEDEIISKMQQTSNSSFPHRYQLKKCQKKISERREEIRIMFNQTYDILKTSSNILELEYYRSCDTSVCTQSSQPSSADSSHALGVASHMLHMPQPSPLYSRFLQPLGGISQGIERVGPKDNAREVSEKVGEFPCTYLRQLDRNMGQKLADQCYSEVNDFIKAVQNYAMGSQKLKSMKQQLESMSDQHRGALEHVATLKEVFKIALHTPEYTSCKMDNNDEVTLERTRELIRSLSQHILPILEEEKQVMRELCHSLNLVAKSNTIGINKTAYHLKVDIEKFQSIMYSVCTSGFGMKVWETSGYSFRAMAKKISQHISHLRSEISIELMRIEQDLKAEYSIFETQERSIQERNRYAVNVIKQVQTKLHGIEDINKYSRKRRIEEGTHHEDVLKNTGNSKGNIKIIAKNVEHFVHVNALEGNVGFKNKHIGQHPFTVTEHVAWMIEEATSSDNLCRLYEGWAPWI